MCSGEGDWTCFQPGFPIRKSSNHSSVASSSRLIAGSYVLHRLLVPRHPPCALKNLTTDIRCSRPLYSSQATGGPNPRTQRLPRNPQHLNDFQAVRLRDQTGSTSPTPEPNPASRKPTHRDSTLGAGPRYKLPPVPSGPNSVPSRLFHVTAFRSSTREQAPDVLARRRRTDSQLVDVPPLS
jgi:hypothetical protein